MPADPERLAKLDLPAVPARDGFDLEPLKLRNDVFELVRAKDRKSGRFVAVQRLLPHVAKEAGTLEAFVAQARAASTWDLRNVLRVHFVARDDDGIYAVVDWPEQGLLEHRLARGPLSGNELLALATGVANGLGEAAARGFLHGRVIASEVLLAADSTPLLSVFGFGLSNDEPSTLLVEEADSETRAPQRSTPTATSDAAQLCQLIRSASRGRDGEPSLTMPPKLSTLLARGLGEDESTRFHDADEILALLEGDATSTARAVTKTEKGKSRGSDGKSSSTQGSVAKDHVSGKGEFPWRPLHEQYRIEGQPQHGGMGSVVRAIEIATGRPVAVKRMKNADPMAIKRFRREASAIARLNHPNVLQLMQAARDDDGDYLVLEWAPNGSLSDRLKSAGKLPLPEVLAIAKKIGAALSYAHSKESIHRDVKPHNILLSETHEPKLADFGLARALDENTLTTTSGGAGSPVYMPPEQWQDSHHADKRSDVYAFAKTLYHLITGEKPATIDKRLVPAELVPVLKKATAAEPDERHSTIDEFVREFCGALERSTPETASSGSSVLRAVVATLFVVGALGVVGFTQRARLQELWQRSVGKGNGSQTTGSPPNRDEQRTDPAGANIVKNESSADSPSNAESRSEEPREKDSNGGSNGGPTDRNGERTNPTSTDSTPKQKDPPPAIEWRGRALRSWADVASALAALPTYRGIALTQQAGLKPLRVDPLSGLLEFAHEATGSAPSFVDKGPYAVTEDSGVVLILLPGGPCVVGAQSRDPKATHYDALATDAEAPPTTLDLAPFFLSKYELTQSQWQRLTGSNPSQARIGATEFGAPIRGQNPVETITWEEAKATLEGVGLRLPSEAQFEYAARAGTSTPWHSGADPESLARYANLADQSTKSAHPNEWKHLADADWAPFPDGFFAHGGVNAFAENPFGFVAIAGNVGEWCLDGYGSYSDPARAGDGARHLEGAATRAVRGGSFAFGPRDARSSARQEAKPNAKFHFVGVRPARDVSP